MSRGKKIKLSVFILHFWVKRLHGINMTKIIMNAITQIRDKTTNATRNQIQFER